MATDAKDVVSEDDPDYEEPELLTEPDEEYASGSDEDADFFELDDRDPKNWHTPDGLEPAFADTRFNQVRYTVRQIMYAVGRFEKRKTAYCDFEKLWDAFGRYGLLPDSFDADDFDPEVADPWAITKDELRRLLSHAPRDANGFLPFGMEDFEKAIAHAPEALPDRIAIDMDDPPEPW